MLKFFATAITLLIATSHGQSIQPVTPPASPPTQAPQDSLVVRVSPRVELMSILMRLAAADEYSQVHTAYAAAVDAHFASFKAHDAVKFLKSVRSDRGIGFDAPMALAVHIREDAWTAKLPLDPLPSRLDSRWTPQAATRMIELCGVFAADSKFDEFFATHETEYHAAVVALSSHVNARPYRAWFDSFFGTKEATTFEVCVGMLNGGANYGVGVKYPDGHEEISPVIGAGDYQQAPKFSAGTTSLLVHEFCHSYTNPLVDEHSAAFAKSGDALFPLRQDLMKPQAYGSGTTMIYESMVRAVTVYFARSEQTPEQAKASLFEERARGFIWTGELTDLLADYASHRAEYPTFAAFMPRVVEFFDRLAAAPEHVTDRLPKVVSIEPASGRTDVDPATNLLHITFDRPMNTKGYSLTGRQAPATPPGVKGTFSDDGKVFTLPVALKNASSYKFSLNSLQFHGFCSPDGFALDPVPVEWRTR